jgi:hypothetical protein
MPCFSMRVFKNVRRCEQACTERIAGGIDVHGTPTRIPVLSLPHLVVTVAFVTKVLELKPVTSRGGDA